MVQKLDSETELTILWKIYWTFPENIDLTKFNRLWLKFYVYEVTTEFIIAWFKHIPSK